MNKVLITIPRGIIYRNFFQTSLGQNLINSNHFNFDFAINPILLDSQQKNNDNNALEFYQTRYSYKAKVYYFFLSIISKKIFPSESQLKLLFYPLFPSLKNKVTKLFYHILPRSKKIYSILKNRFENELINNNNHILNKLQKGSFKIYIATNPTSKDELGYIIAARRLNIRTVALIKSVDNVSTKGFFPIQFDYFIVWNEYMQKELNDIFKIDRKRIFVCGIPHISNEALEKVNFSKIFPNHNLTILYATVSKFINPNDPNIVKFLISQSKKMKFNLIIRIHQMDEESRWSFIQETDNIKVSVQGKNTDSSEVKVATQGSFQTLHNDIYNSDIIVNTCSTIVYEAILHDKVCINLSIDPQDSKEKQKTARFYSLSHYRPIVESTCVGLVRNYEELIKEINDFERKQKNIDFKKEQMELREKLIPFSAQNYSQKLEELLLQFDDRQLDE